MTLVFQLVRNSLLVGCVLVFTRSTDVPVINRVVAGGTAVISLLTALLWGLMYLFEADIRAALSSLHTVIGGVKKGFEQPLIRSQWFVGDPNFYSIILVVGLFCAVEVARRRGQRRYYVEAFAIATALFFTLSRTGIGSMLVAGALATYTSLHRRDRSLLALKSEWKTIVLSVFGIIGLFFTTPVFRILQNRMKFGLFSGRLKLWQTLLDSLGRGIVAGHGLRSIEALLGRYAHNTYLSLLFQTGFVGLGTYFLTVGTVLRYGLRKVKTNDLGAQAPWFYAFIALGAFHIGYTYIYMPLAWLVPAVVFAETQTRETWTFTLSEISARIRP